MDRKIPSPGTKVQHFKRELKPEGDMYYYTIIGVATDTETGEDMMVYQALYGDRKMYCRPLDIFLSEVDHVRYPDIKQKYRFEEI